MSTVHDRLRRNRRQAHAVSRFAGTQNLRIITSFTWAHYLWIEIQSCVAFNLSVITFANTHKF